MEQEEVGAEVQAVSAGVLEAELVVVKEAQVRVEELEVEMVVLVAAVEELEVLGVE